MGNGGRDRRWRIKVTNTTYLWVGFGYPFQCCCHSYLDVCITKDDEEDERKDHDGGQVDLVDVVEETVSSISVRERVGCVREGYELNG